VCLFVVIPATLRIWLCTGGYGYEERGEESGVDDEPRLLMIEGLNEKLEFYCFNQRSMKISIKSKYVHT
jgi:hypothetical protein